MDRFHGLDRNSRPLSVVSRSTSDLCRRDSRKKSGDACFAPENGPSIDRWRWNEFTSRIRVKLGPLSDLRATPVARSQTRPSFRSNHVGSHGNGVATRSVLQLASSCGSSAEDGKERVDIFSLLGRFRSLIIYGIRTGFGR